jgi:hypothetical protein
MNDLVGYVSNQSGLSPDMARLAVSLVMDYARRQSPELGEVLDIGLGTSELKPDQVTRLLDGFMGMLGTSPLAAHDCSQ